MAILVSRDGEACTRSVTSVNAGTLKRNLREYVARSARLYSDEWWGNLGQGKELASHETTRRADREYPRHGGLHSNTAECCFSLLKRGVYGQFHHVSM